MTIAVNDGVPEVVWVYRRGRRAWLAEWRQGARSSEFFYGLLPLRDRYRVGFVEEDTGLAAHRRWWYPAERIIASRVGMGFALDLVLRHRRLLNRARVIISTTDTCGLPLAWLKRRGVIRTPLIYISQGLSDRVAAYGKDRHLSRWYRRLLLGVDSLATLSAGAACGLSEWLEIPRARVTVLPFGVDHVFWHPTTEPDARGDYILSVGSDPGRDYPTLLAASDTLPLRIVTRQALPLADRPSVRCTSEHSPAELRDLYGRARFAVFPLLDRDQPSGQSAALQAMACGTAVVVTRTRGWWGESMLRDGENCVTVPPGDVGALRQALTRLWRSPQTCASLGARARDTVVAHFGEMRFAECLAGLVDVRLMAPTVPAG